MELEVENNPNRSLPDSEVDYRHVGYRDTEGHTGQFAVQGRNDFADGFGSSSSSWDDVLLSSTSVTPQLLKEKSFKMLIVDDYYIHSKLI